MSNIGVVIKDISDIADKNAISNNKEGLIHDLKKLKRDLQYAAPETLKSSYYFNKLSVVLSANISTSDYEEIEWCRKIIDIFLDPNYKT